jgi:hypothetical protein
VVLKEWLNNIKVVLTELEWEILDWIHLPGGKNQCWALLVKGMIVASGIVQCEGRLADRLQVLDCLAC